MFCVQCETNHPYSGQGTAALTRRVMCGKTAETSDLQDLLIASLQGLVCMGC